MPERVTRGWTDGDLDRAIVAACLRRPDLRWHAWESGHPLGGFCYVATMALCTLDPSCTPYACEVPGGKHYFALRDTGEIVDLTAAQFDFRIDYEAAHRVPVRQTKRVEALIEEILK